MIERSSTDRLLGELVAGLRSLEKSVDGMNERFDAQFVVLRKDVDDLKASRSVGKGALIVISSITGIGGIIAAKLPAILTALIK